MLDPQPPGGETRPRVQKQGRRRGGRSGRKPRRGSSAGAGHSGYSDRGRSLNNSYDSLPDRSDDDQGSDDRDGASGTRRVGFDDGTNNANANTDIDTNTDNESYPPPDGGTVPDRPDPQSDGAARVLQRETDLEAEVARKLRQVRELEARLTVLRDTPAEDLHGFGEFVRGRAAVRIQALVRGWAARRAFSRNRDGRREWRAALIVQRWVRRARERARATREGSSWLSTGASGVDAGRGLHPIGVPPDDIVSRSARAERVDREIRQWRTSHAAEVDTGGAETLRLRTEARRRLQDNARHREAERVREIQRAQLLSDMKAMEERLERFASIDDVGESAVIDLPLPPKGRLAAAKEALAALERRFATAGMERWWELPFEEMVKRSPESIGLGAENVNGNHGTALDDSNSSNKSVAM